MNGKTSVFDKIDSFFHVNSLSYFIEETLSYTQKTYLHGIDLSRGRLRPSFFLNCQISQLNTLAFLKIIAI